MYHICGCQSFANSLCIVNGIYFVLKLKRTQSLAIQSTFILPFNQTLPKFPNQRQSQTNKSTRFVSEQMTLLYSWKYIHEEKNYWDVLISLKQINGICLSPFSERNKYQTPVVPRRWINKILGNKSQSMWQSLKWSKFWLIRSACCCFGFNQSPKQSTRIPVLLNFNDD